MKSTRLWPLLGAMSLMHCGGAGNSSADAAVDGAGDATTAHDAGVDARTGHDATVDHFVRPPPVDAGQDSGPTVDGGCTLPVPFADGGVRTATLTNALDAWAAAFEATYVWDGGLRCPGAASGVAVRDLTNYALATVTLGRANAAENAGAMLECAFHEYQDYSATAPGPTNGAFRLLTSDTAVDPTNNATELALQALPALLASGRLSQAVVADLTPRIVAALRAVEQHDVPVSYTSIWLMQAMELSALGSLATADAGTGPGDAGHDARPDARKDASHEDAGHEDAGHEDAGRQDGGHEDAGHEDAGHADAGHADAGHADAAHVDAGFRDAAHDDAAHADAAHADAAHEDAAHRDAGHEDAAHGDAAHKDAEREDAHVDAARVDGHAVHDARVDAPPASYDFLADGALRLGDWVTFARQAGISEYDSPTYYETDLDSLWMGYRFAPADQQPIYGSILGTFWADISASTIVANGNIVGPYSRTLDFFRSHGDLEVALFLEGLRLGPAVTFSGSRPDFDTVFALINAAPGGFHPTHETLCLSQGTHEVRSTWAEGAPDAANAGRQRYAYLTPEFALGSTSDNYLGGAGGQDEPVQAQFPSFDMPVITVLPDYLDDPGVIIGGIGGPSHLALNPSAAQLGGAMLVLLRIDAVDPLYTTADGGPIPVVNLSTNIMFPAGADEVYVGGSDVDAAAPMSLGRTPTLVVRQGAGAVAVRVLDTTGLECPASADAAAGAILDRDSGASARYTPWQSFPDASIQNVGRLALYHVSTAALPESTASIAHCFARVALLVMGQACQGTTCAAELASAVDTAVVTDTWDPSTAIWAVSALVPDPDGGTTSLHVTRLVVGNPFLTPVTRLVDDASLPFAPLEVNGVPIPIAP